MQSVAAPRAGIAALLGLCSTLCATRAAGEAAEPVHLLYDAPAPCPSQNDFLDMVARDGGRLVPVADPRTARTFTVRIEGHDPLRGTLVVREADGAEAARELSGSRCDDVVRSLAVLVALSLEPPPPPAETQAPEMPPSVPVPGLAAIQGNQVPEPEPSVHATASGSRPDWRVGVSSEGTFSKGASPSLDPSLAVYLEFVDDAPAFFAPSLRIGAEIAADQRLESGGPMHYEIATFRRIVGRVDACPSRATLSRPWSDDAFTLQACARADVGRLDVETPDPGFPGARTGEAKRLWLSPAALLRVRWTSPRFFVEVEGGVAFPLLRERFFRQDALVFEVPPVAETAGFGFGWFFW